MKRGENFLLYLQKKRKIRSILYYKIQLENVMKNLSHHIAQSRQVSPKPSIKKGCLWYGTWKKIL
jgi:hypothetical protein